MGTGYDWIHKNDTNKFNFAFLFQNQTHTRASDYYELPILNLNFLHDRTKREKGFTDSMNWIVQMMPTTFYWKLCERTLITACVIDVLPRTSYEMEIASNFNSYMLHIIKWHGPMNNFYPYSVYFRNKLQVRDAVFRHHFLGIHFWFW